MLKPLSLLGQKEKKSGWENYEFSNITKRTVAKGKEFFSVSVADESVN